MESMSRSKSRIACFVIPVVLAACRFELPEPGTGSEQVEIDAPVGPSCGDAVHDQGEACDTGGDTKACDGDCTAPECGDGYLNAEAGEECDRDSGCASPSELCGLRCKCQPGTPPPRLHGGAGGMRDLRSPGREAAASGRQRAAASR